MTRNQIELRSVKEQERHNLVVEGLEKEKNRFTEEHYIRSDQAAMSQAGAAWANVEVNRINALTNRMAVEETIRYHDLSIGVEEKKLELQGQQLVLQTWKSEADVKLQSMDIALQRGNLEFQQQKWSEDIGFQKEKWGEQYSLNRYTANLEGLQFKENIRQYEGNLAYKYYDTNKDYKAKQTGNVLNFVGNILRTGASLVGAGLKAQTDLTTAEWKINAGGY